MEDPKVFSEEPNFMSTLKQIQANRQSAPPAGAANSALADRLNARNSTGPRTQAGRAAARNSLQHGCYASQVVLEGQHQEAFQGLRPPPNPRPPRASSIQ